MDVGSVLTRVAYLLPKLTDRYFLKVMQVYAQPLTHITKEMRCMTKAHNNAVMQDFNAEVALQEFSEKNIGSQGLRRRNHRRQMLVNFLES